VFNLINSEMYSTADIKGFLMDVKPALLSALDTEYEKNPFEVHQVCVIMPEICLLFVDY